MLNCFRNVPYSRPSMQGGGWIGENGVECERGGTSWSIAWGQRRQTETSKRCTAAWDQYSPGQAAHLRQPISFWSRPAWRSTTNATAGWQPRTKTFIVRDRVGHGWNKSSAWKRGVRSTMIGWCAKVVVCCRLSAIAIVTLRHGLR